MDVTFSASTPKGDEQWAIGPVIDAVRRQGDQLAEKKNSVLTAVLFAKFVSWKTLFGSMTATK